MIEILNQSDRYVDKLRVFTELATSLARLSRCSRKQVGAVIIPADLSNVLAIGYNGPPAGEPNDSCRGGEGSCGCIHSEANALVKLSIDRKDLILVTTLSPCEHCAGLILNCGKISGVLYGEEYRDTRGLDLLLKRDVQLVNWNEL